MQCHSVALNFRVNLKLQFAIRGGAMLLLNRALTT